MNKIECEKFALSKDFKEFIENSNDFCLKDIQTFFPIMNNFQYFNNSQYTHENYILKSRFKLIDFSSKEGIVISCDKGTENYKSYNAFLFDDLQKKTLDKQIFMKQSPILDPLLHMMNKYPNSKHNNHLPFSIQYSKELNRKINSQNNATYIDCFFTYLGSKLVENNLCPGFPLYYGSYCGVAREFEHDITEEYDDYLRKPWFIKGNKKKSLFSLRYIRNNEEYESSIEHNDNSPRNDDESSMNEDSSSMNEDSSSMNEDSSSMNEDSSSMNEDLLSIDTNISNIPFFKVDNSSLNTLYYDNDNISIKEIEANTLNEIPEIDNLKKSDGSVKFDDDKEVYAILKNFPVQLVCMEKCQGTLEDILEKTINDYRKIISLNKDEDVSTFIKDRDYEWCAYLLQICFSLAIAQKHYDFTHNDLHSSNIMFVLTEDEYIYYKFKNKYYSIPTFGKILKIIDFGRAIYKVNGNEYFSDVFELNSDAGGQYTYPDDRKNTKNVIYPNKSFDLSRLSTSIILDLFPENPKCKENGKYLSKTQKETDSKLFNLLYSWIVDKYRKEVTRYEDFDLYKIIARRMTNAKPENQISKEIFNKYIINESELDLKKGSIYVF